MGHFVLLNESCSAKVPRFMADQNRETITAPSPDGHAATKVVPCEAKRDHVVLFPFMGKSHTISLLHLASALSSRGFHLTLITTPLNIPFFRRYLPPDRHPFVDIHTLPFPVLPPLPSGVESSEHLPSFDLFPTFLRATSLLRDPFHRLLLRLLDGGAAPPPLCLISDFFLWWTVPICRQVGLPRLAFHGMSAFGIAITKSLVHRRPHSTGAAAFHVPGTPPSLLFTQDDVPNHIRVMSNVDDPMTKLLLPLSEDDLDSWGMLVNSYAELDSDYIELAESFFRGGARAWLVGPFFLLPEAAAEADPESESEAAGCLRWLDAKTRGTVVYASFGTLAHVSDSQLDEVAHGLAQSGYEFLLVTRTPTWLPPVDTESLGSKVVCGWVPQRQVLLHEAVGGFVSHCGWNSVLESLAAGVPILAWPMIAEQHINAKHVADVLGAGVVVGGRPGREAVGREAVAEGVREVMGSGGERGRRARKRAEELQRAAAVAGTEGGSSYSALEDLMAALRKIRTNIDGRQGASGSVGALLQVQGIDNISTEF